MSVWAGRAGWVGVGWGVAWRGERGATSRTQTVTQIVGVETGPGVGVSRVYRGLRGVKAEGGRCFAGDRNGSVSLIPDGQLLAARLLAHLGDPPRLKGPGWSRRVSVVSCGAVACPGLVSTGVLAVTGVQNTRAHCPITMPHNVLSQPSH